MTALAAFPPGISPVDYLNFVAKLQAYSQKEQGRQQQQSQQQAYAQQQRQYQGYNAANDQQLQMLMQLIQANQGASQEARDANEKRRNEILAGRTDTRNRILDQWNEYGDSLVSDTNKGYDKNLKNSLAALSQSGLLQSTVNSSIRAQNEEGRQDSMRRVKDDIISNYANTDERLSNNIDEFNERITDSYPDTNSMTALASQLGSVIPRAGGGVLNSNMGNLNPGMSGRNTVQSPMAPWADLVRTNPNLPFSGYRLPPPPAFGSAMPMGGGGYGGYGARSAGFGANVNRGAGYSAQAPPQLRAPVAPTNTPIARTAGDAPMQQLPWNYGLSPGANPGSQVQNFVMQNGQMVNARQPMPALGIFGAGVQMQNTGGYGGGGYGGGAAGGYSRTPLWSRDPGFANRLAGMGLNPQGNAQNQQQPQQQQAYQQPSGGGFDLASLLQMLGYGS